MPQYLARYEFIQFGAGHTARGAEVVGAEGQRPLKSGYLSLGGTPTATGDQPVVPTPAESGDVFLRIATVAPIMAYFAVGAAPDPTSEPRHLLVSSEQERLVSVTPGHRLSVVGVSNFG